MAGKVTEVGSRVDRAGRETVVFGIPSYGVLVRIIGPRGGSLHTSYFGAEEARYLGRLLIEAAERAER